MHPFQLELLFVSTDSAENFCPLGAGGTFQRNGGGWGEGVFRSHMLLIERLLLVHHTAYRHGCNVKDIFEPPIPKINQWISNFPPSP